jgi:DNA primase large subunit
VPERLKPLLEKVKAKLAKRASKGPVGRARGLVPEALPPCVKAIYSKALQGENLSHQERFALATFLLNVGLDVEQVLEVFRNMPDYNERIARYQVEHLAGLRGSQKKYSPPSCRTMVSWGLCPGREECKRNHPLSEYYRRLKLTRAPSRESPPSRREPRQAP